MTKSETTLEVVGCSAVTLGLRVHSIRVFLNCDATESAVSEAGHPSGRRIGCQASYQRSRSVRVLSDDWLDGVVGAESTGLGLDYDGVCVFDRGEIGLPGQGGVLFPETEGALIFHVDCVTLRYPVQECRVVQQQLGSVKGQGRVGSVLPVVRMFRAHWQRSLAASGLREPSCPDLGVLSPDSSAAFCHQCRWSRSLPGFSFREMVCNRRL